MSVITLNNSIIVKEYPKFLILTYGFLFARMMGILQVSHILNSPFKVYRPVFLIPLISILIHSIIFYFTRKPFIVNVDILIILSFIWNIVTWAHFVYFCSEEICNILNINRFFLGERFLSIKEKESDKKNN